MSATQIALARSGPVFCLGSSSHLAAHFDLDDSGPRARIISVKLTGLDAAQCNALPVNVRLVGNQEGNPSVPPPALLSTLDSTKDPCTGASVDSPVLVSHGGVTLTTCATSASPAGSTVDVHDLTLMIVRIGNDEVSFRPGGSSTQACGQPDRTCVLGEKMSRQLGKTEVHGSALAFTGAWIAFSVAVGAGLLGLGVLLSRVRRRRTAAHARP